jgi:hypothetical protein
VNIVVLGFLCASAIERSSGWHDLQTPLEHRNMRHPDPDLGKSHTSRNVSPANARWKQKVDEVNGHDLFGKRRVRLIPSGERSVSGC